MFGKTFFSMGVAVLLMMTACAADDLKWNPPVREGLDALIERHRGEANAYAVFDCDNTTVIGDISQAYQIVMLEELHFACTPGEMKALLLKDIPNINRPLAAGRPAFTSANLAADLADAYRELLEMKKSGVDYRKSPVFDEFAAKYQSFYHGLISAFGTKMAYPWIGYLLAGYTRAEIAEFECHAMKVEIARGAITQQRFTVPQSQWRRAGLCSAEYTRGLAVPPENVALFAALRKAGITPHIVSASNRELLLAVFATKEFGFDLPESSVYGYTFRHDEAGKVLPEHTTDMWMPQQEGKVDFIRRELMPRFGGREPVLVGGDSMGDYAMLTSFKAMDRGLIFNHRPLRDDPLSKLVRESLSVDSSRYLIQGRDNATASLVPSPLCKVPSQGE